MHERAVMQGKACRFMLIVWAFAWPALATGQPPGEVASPRPAAVLFEANFPTATRHDDASGNLRLLTHIDQPRPTHATSSREHAMDFIARWGEALGLSPLQWRYEKTERYRGREVVHLEQTSGELTVIGGAMRMTFSERGDLLMLTCQTYKDLLPLLRGPISPARARAMAEDRFGAAVASQRAVALPLGASGRMLLVHELLLERQGAEIARTRVRLDSRDGRVISKTSLAHAL